MASNWYKCKGGIWCDLYKLDIEHDYLKKLDGVFVIWAGDIKDHKVINVGSGNIRSKLMTAKSDKAIQAFTNVGVFVSWTEVGAFKRAGVELYLINSLKPLIVYSTPKGIPIKTPFPWEDD